MLRHQAQATYPGSTQISLLARLAQQPGDAQAWTRFIDIYGPHILQWCRAQGLQEADALDVTQEALIRFWKMADRFEYDPGKSFRNYLHTLVRSTWYDWIDQGKRQASNEFGPDIATVLHNLPAREDLITRLEQAFDQELLSNAMRIVRNRIEPQTWEAFRLLALEGRTGKETAELLGMKVASVIAARCDVQRLIRKTIERLENADTLRFARHGLS